jgi:glycosyltransferase involved in cell wall biosynthesis
MKILILGNSLNLNSGFSRVAKALILGLKALGHDMYFVGMQTAYTPQFCDGIEMLPLNTFAFDELTQYGIILARIQPDIAINIFQSDGGAGPGLENFPLAFKKTIWYTVVEGNYLGDTARNGLRRVIGNGGRVLLPSLHGQGQCRIDGIDAEVIPYGYDPRVFYKSGKCPDVVADEMTSLLIWNKDDKKWEQHGIKVGELGGYRGFNRKFIFGSVKQNVGIRHRMERLIKAFSIFISESRQIKDNAMLHLHTLPFAANGMNLLDVIKRISSEYPGIEENIVFSYGDYRSSGWSDNALAVLYNTFDCYCSASSGEGLGLPTLEAMACGVPVVGPASSAFNELVDDRVFDMDSGPRGLLCDGMYQRIDDGSERFLVDEKHLAINMREIYKGNELRKYYGENCLSFTKDFTWDKQIEKWDKYLKDYIGK